MEMSGCQLSHSFDTVATMPPPCSPHKPPCSAQCSTVGRGRRARRQAAPQEDEGREDGVWEQERGSSWEQDGSTLPPRSHCRTLSRASCTMRSTTLRRRREESGAGQCHGAGAGGHCAGTLASGQHCGQRLKYIPKTTNPLYMGLIVIKVSQKLILLNFTPTLDRRGTQYCGADRR